MQLNRWAATCAVLVASLAFSALPLTARAATPARTDATSPRAAAAPTPPPAPAAPPAAAVLADNRGHLYYLDGWGGLHPADGSPNLTTTAYWAGWDIAKGVALFGDGGGGYVVDGWGGLHPVGNAPAVSASGYWPNWDIARAVALAPWASAASPAGWVLDGWGGTHPFGGAPKLAWYDYWPGWDIARGLVILPDSTPGAVGGYVVDGWGGLHPLGNAHGVRAGAYWPGWDIARGLALLPTATNAAPTGYVLDGWGGLQPFGGAPAVRGTAYWQGWDIARSLVPWTGAAASTPGGWVLDGWGGLHAYGSAVAIKGSDYWAGWDIARGAAGSGTGSGSREAPARTLSVPYYRQIHNLDCEAAALQMALAYKGIGVSQDSILGAIGVDGRSGYYDSNGRLHWGDPYASFVGSVNGSENDLSGYGVFYPPIAGAAQRFGAGIAGQGQGWAPQQIYSAVINGHPVVAWITTDWSYHGVLWYTAFDGHPVMFTPTEHAVVVIGVSQGSVLVNNPLYGPQWVSKSTFESAFATFDNMAVIVF